uniref:Anoctamin n=1 Tax=Strigamia maritima TaxID=126957 RepID=T1JP88_STRMM
MSSSTIPGSTEQHHGKLHLDRGQQTSEMSLYQSALDLQDFAKLDPRGSVVENLPLSTHEVLQGIAEETNVTTPITPIRVMTNSSALYFRDGMRKIDFMLAHSVDSEPESTGNEIRKTFESSLLEDGLQLEYEYRDDKRVQFIKIHASWEVLTRYAEIMKFKMPMKVSKYSIDALERDEIFLLFQSEVAIKDTYLGQMTKSVGHRITKCFKYDDTLFPPADKRFTCHFSREKEYLFDIPINRDAFFSTAQRGLIVYFILRRSSFSLDKKTNFATTGIHKLMAEGVYTAYYPLHEGEITDSKDAPTPRGLLYSEWASLRKIFKQQPLDHIKHYLGVKCGLYFAWLGFYTYMLIPASIVGFFCFVYGLVTMNDFIPSKEVCEFGQNITMCPVCDLLCDYWKLNQTCIHTKITYLFDNPATLVFAVFMSFWSALFLELWKRYSANITHRWDLTGFDPNSQQPRPEYLAKLAKLKKTKELDLKDEPKIPFWRWQVPTTIISWSIVLLMATIAVAAVLGVIFYRMSVMTALALYYDESQTSMNNRNAPLITSVTAAMINLICIMILNQVYRRIAVHLTELELPRTQIEYDDSLTLKMFLLQFINYYASIFYIAFIKGKVIGRPGAYNRLFGKFRQEECGPGGCLMELSIQLSIIMIGKQVLNTIMEMSLPVILRAYKSIKSKTTIIKRSTSASTKTSWERDYPLLAWSSQELFGEYLEMVLQFGFVTIFVAAFPLAPLFALLNNLFEMRLDAKKILTYYQRPIGRRVKNIGIWYRILDGIGKLAVITNAFIIAFTSNFIPRMVYLNFMNDHGTLQGYVNYSLSYFNTSDFTLDERPRDPENNGIEVCRYEDYRKHFSARHQYSYTHYFWHVLAARFAFVVVFENVIVFVVTLLRWLIPDESRQLREAIRQENYVINELIVQQEFVRARVELFRTNNPRSIRFSNDPTPIDRNHLSKSAIKKRPNRFHS